MPRTWTRLPSPPPSSDRQQLFWKTFKCGVWQSPFLNFQANMPVSRMRMRPWLEKMINSDAIDGLTWLDQVSGSLDAALSWRTGIPWKVVLSISIGVFAGENDVLHSLEACSQTRLGDRKRCQPIQAVGHPHRWATHDLLSKLKENQTEDFNSWKIYLQENTQRAENVTRKHGKPTSAVRWTRCLTSRRSKRWALTKATKPCVSSRCCPWPQKLKVREEVGRISNTTVRAQGDVSDFK